MKRLYFYFTLLSVFLLGVSCDKMETTDPNPMFMPLINAWYDFIDAFTDQQKIDDSCIKAWEAYKKDMPELAYSHLEEILDYRQHWKPYAMRATIKYNMGETKIESAMALHDYKQALELNRNRQTFRINKDDSISYQLLYERICWCLVYLPVVDADAVITIQKGLLEFPESIALTNAMSVAYTKTGDFSLAEKWAKKVLEKDAGKGYFCLAYLASVQERHQESIKYFEKCLELDPNYSNAKHNLALQYREVGRTHDALTLFREAAQDGNKYSQNWLKRNGYTW